MRVFHGGAPARTVVAALLVGTLLAGGCGSGDDDADPASTAPVATDQDGEVTQPPTTPPAGGDPQVSHAVADLADQLAIDEAAVVVITDEQVTWPDGSIGCPQPGIAYTQALVDGRRIILEADGATYAYHAAGADVPFRCEAPTPPIGGS